MTLATAPRRHEQPREERNHLEVVVPRPARRARPRTIYAIITVITLLAIVVSQLLLSITVSQGAYEIDSLQAQQRSLQRGYQSASETLERMRSPQNLAANARALGMVPSSAPVFLRLSDGAVLGTPARAGGESPSASLVPNALLTGVPSVSSKAHAKPGSGTPKAPVQAAVPVTPAGPVIPDGPLPAPKTH